MVGKSNKNGWENGCLFVWLVSSKICLPEKNGWISRKTKKTGYLFLADIVLKSKSNLLLVCKKQLLNHALYSTYSLHSTHTSTQHLLNY